MYISTRGKNNCFSSSSAMIKGIADDYGLYVPEEIPQITSPLSSMINLDYKELALYILKLYFTDINKADLEECINSAYDDKFNTKEITPMVTLSNISFLELFHGPTLAFKDIALSIFPYLLQKAMNNKNITKNITILTATSGDTGKAALEGFKNVPGINVIVFYPKNGVSKIQELQMTTQEGSNLHVVGLNGNFDEAQSAVKRIFNSETIINDLYKNNYILSSANSINIGRFIPQIVYYFYSYLTLLKNNKICCGEKVNFTIPTGNFGDILAGYYAREMGLPINKLICASNENNVLTDFLNTGIYDINRKFKTTSSPSMDILISSNLERLIFHLSNNNTKLINSLYLNLSEKGHFKIPDYINNKLDIFYGNYATEKDTNLAINEVYNKYNYLIDPHTAVAYSVYKKYTTLTRDTTHNIILSTANPYKFPETMCNALEINTNSCEINEIFNILSNSTSTFIPTQLQDIFTKNIKHKLVCNENEMKETIFKLLGVD